MNNSNRKFHNFKNALNKLKEGILKFDEANDLLIDGLIQRFEFTFELASEKSIMSLIVLLCNKINIVIRKGFII